MGGEFKEVELLRTGDVVFASGGEDYLGIDYSRAANDGYDEDIYDAPARESHAETDGRSRVGPHWRMRFPRCARLTCSALLLSAVPATSAELNNTYLSVQTGAKPDAPIDAVSTVWQAGRWKRCRTGSLDGKED